MYSFVLEVLSKKTKNNIEPSPYKPKSDSTLFFVLKILFKNQNNCLLEFAYIESELSYRQTQLSNYFSNKILFNCVSPILT